MRQPMLPQWHRDFKVGTTRKWQNQVVCFVGLLPEKFQLS
jgi:hypothetical protein